jgi:putative ABC transport system permease protein
MSERCKERLMHPQHWLYTIPLRLRSLFRREAVEQDLSDELRDHLEHKTQFYLASGFSPEDARRTAVRDIDGLELRKEQCRDARRLNLVDSLLRDFRYAARSLRKSPGFTLIAILILTLGIGANVAIFSMVNALLLHPYSFPDLDRLVRVWEDRGIDEGPDFRLVAPADVADLSASTKAFRGITTFRYAAFNLSVSGNAEPVRSSRVSSNFFDILGVTPALGRTFSPTDDSPGSNDVAILTYALWQHQFAGDPSVLGKTLRLNGRVYTVVGVMPPGFTFPAGVQMWVPLALTPAEQNSRSPLSLEALARLKPGVSRASALAELGSFSRRLGEQYPRTNANRTATFLELRKELYLYTLPLFLLLQAGAVFVLLLACANLANLLLARMIARKKEIAVRAALGAGRLRISVLFTSETLLLSLVAGAIAVCVSFWTVNLLRTSISPAWTMWVPGWDAIRVDRSILIFAIALTVLVGILFGVTTVFQAARFDLNTALKDAGRGVSRSKTRVQNTLVVLQIGLALVLLVSAGLTTQGFFRLASAYQGFDPANVLHTEIALPKDLYSDNVKSASFFRQFLNDARALPGVASASLIANPPASNVDNETVFFTIEGRQTVNPNQTPSAERQIASPDYFETLRIRLVSGRAISQSDLAAAPRIAVISQTMAARFWPTGDALGHRFKLGPADSTEPWLTIVGVVSDLRQNWWNPVARPVLYQPLDQASSRSMTLLLRGNADPLSYGPAVREIIRRLDPDVAIPSLHTFEHEIGDSIAIIRILGVLMAIFGFVGLILASVGVYGVLTEAVAQRTREIGIRMSFGADTRSIRRLILTQAFGLAATGLFLGAPLAFFLNRIMSSTLFGVVPLNAPLVAAVGISLLLVAFAAAYVPARRAMRLDPLRALHDE